MTEEVYVTCSNCVDTNGGDLFTTRRPLERFAPLCKKRGQNWAERAQKNLTFDQKNEHSPWWTLPTLFVSARRASDDDSETSTILRCVELSKDCKIPVQIQDAARYHQLDQLCNR